MGLSTFLNGRNPTTLRGLRMLALTDTGVVQTRTATSDSGGGVTQVWAAGGTVPCRIDPISDRGGAATTAGRIDERSTHLVTCTFGAAVTSNSRVVIAGRGTYEVTATRERTDAVTQVFEVVEAS